MCAELCTSSLLLSGKELEEFQGEEAANLFVHDRNENSITTLPWRLNPGGSVSTFLTASRHFGLCQQLFASKKTLLKVQQDQNVRVKCWEGRGSSDMSVSCGLTELRGAESCQSAEWVPGPCSSRDLSSWAGAGSTEISRGCRRMFPLIVLCTAPALGDSWLPLQVPERGHGVAVRGEREQQHGSGHRVPAPGLWLCSAAHCPAPPQALLPQP